MKNTFNTLQKLPGASNTSFFSLSGLEKQNFAAVDKLPFSIKILLESALRNENGVEITADDVRRIAKYNPGVPISDEIPFMPARILMQDFTGVPAIVDLAALRSAVRRHGGAPEKINPLIPVDLVVDHSIQVDHFASSQALQLNSDLEFQRNRERYEFLRWGQKAFSGFSVIPPASGICHQVNLEYLGKVVQTRGYSGVNIAFPDSLVGTDSHTPMINGLGIVGWGVGGIEAESVMLGQPLYMLTPDVVGCKLTGGLRPGVTATDLVLTITQILRKKGVVDKFVEFFGAGLSSMSVPDRATISNMAPEYGATIGYFPIDHRTLEYLKFTGRPPELIELVEIYCKEQGLFRTDNSPAPIFKDIVELDLSAVEPSAAGPKRPQDRSSLHNLPAVFKNSLTSPPEKQGFAVPDNIINNVVEIKYPDGTYGEITHGQVLIAAITSCTNTSNPSVMLAAGLLAKKAVEAGLEVPPYVKTSLAPGSKVVTDYLTKSGLLPYLEKLGFHIVGYGCTTCIGNSGPLPEHIAKAVESGGLIASAVLSGNRNFTGRINPHTKASFLMSPPLVIAFALAGKITVDLENDPIGQNPAGKNIYLRDIWPSAEEVDSFLSIAQDPASFRETYSQIYTSNETWNAISAEYSPVYNWDPKSGYIQEPPFFVNISPDIAPIAPIHNARVLVKAGDSVTTDHISPAGSIHPQSPAGKYLLNLGVAKENFNSYGSRRGNDRIMTRGTFANTTFRNLLAPGKEGSFTLNHLTGDIASIYDTAMLYIDRNIPSIVIAGSDYGMGSSRDWAAKGTNLLGIKAVLAKSFERIHRSNLVGMGILPLQFRPGEDADALNLVGNETYDILIDDKISPRRELTVKVTPPDSSPRNITIVCRLDSLVEIDYYRNGGILNAALRKVLK